MGISSMRGKKSQGTRYRVLAGLAFVAALSELWAQEPSRPSQPLQQPRPAPNASTGDSTAQGRTGVPGASEISPRPGIYEEEAPAIGTGNLLSDVQVRYCLAQIIRIEAVRPLLNKYKKEQIGYFNELAADYNSRCKSYRYQGDTLQDAKAIVEARRSRIQDEAREAYAKRFGGTPVALPSKPEAAPIPQPPLKQERAPAPPPAVESRNRESAEGEIKTVVPSVAAPAPLPQARQAQEGASISAPVVESPNARVDEGESKAVAPTNPQATPTPPPQATQAQERPSISAPAVESPNAKADVGESKAAVATKPEAAPTPPPQATQTHERPSISAPAVEIPKAKADVGESKAVPTKPEAAPTPPPQAKQEHPSSSAPAAESPNAKAVEGVGKVPMVSKPVDAPSPLPQAKQDRPSTSDPMVDPRAKADEGERQAALPSRRPPSPMPGRAEEPGRPTSAPGLESRPPQAQPPVETALPAPKLPTARIEADGDAVLKRFSREVQRFGSQFVEQPDDPQSTTQKSAGATTQIEVRYAAGGYIRSIVVGQSSGNALLDERALEIARGMRFPDVPTELHSRDFAVRFPIVFRPHKS